jgi:hypothetical protein
LWLLALSALAALVVFAMVDSKERVGRSRLEFARPSETAEPASESL